MTHSRIAVVVAVAALVLAGCASGESDPTGDESKRSDPSGLSAPDLLSKAESVIEEKATVQMKGQGIEQGSDFVYDLSYVGDAAEGYVSIDGAKLSLLRVDGETYFKADDAFWRAQGGDEYANLVAEAIGDRWISIRGEEAFKFLEALARRTFITVELFQPTDALRMGEAKVIDEVDCLSLVDSEGTIWVTADDALPVQANSNEGKEEAVVKFTYEDASVPRAPAASQVIDASKLI